MDGANKLKMNWIWKFSKEKIPLLFYPKGQTCFTVLKIISSLCLLDQYFVNTTNFNTQLESWLKYTFLGPFLVIQIYKVYGGTQ